MIDFGCIADAGAGAHLYSGTAEPPVTGGTDLAPRAPQRRPLEGASLLLVDDDARLRRAVRRVLVLERASLVEAADGEEALRILEGEEAHLLDAVLTDLEMPAVSGQELIAVLEECRPDLPIVGMTGNARSAALGGVPLLLKPFSPDELVQTLTPLVRRSQEMRRRARQSGTADLRATLERQRTARTRPRRKRRRR